MRSASAVSPSSTCCTDDPEKPLAIVAIASFWHCSRYISHATSVAVSCRSSAPPTATSSANRFRRYSLCSRSISLSCSIFTRNRSALLESPRRSYRLHFARCES